MSESEIKSRWLRYDFMRNGWWVGPWFLRDETRYRIWGWWPPERRRREILAVRATARADGYWKGREAGWKAYSEALAAVIENVYGVKQEAIPNAKQQDTRSEHG